LSRHPKPHTILVAKHDSGFRIEIEGLFKNRRITILDSEIDLPVFSDCGDFVSMMFGMITVTVMPHFGAHHMDGEEVKVRHSQCHVGDTSAFRKALHRYCQIVNKDGKDRTFKTDITRSFSRETRKRANFTSLTAMQIINHPKFEGAWPCEEPERLSPWSTLRLWHQQLKPAWWSRLKDDLSLKLHDGGDLTCSYTNREINFNWVGMYGAMILGKDHKYSSHT